jgi:hypothetical protein
VRLAYEKATRSSPTGTNWRPTPASPGWAKRGIHERIVEQSAKPKAVLSQRAVVTALGLILMAGFFFLDSVVQYVSLFTLGHSITLLAGVSSSGD